MKIKMLIELDYNAKSMHANDPDAIEWFNNDILLSEDGELLLHSNGIGDTIGSVKVIEILKEVVSLKCEHDFIGSCSGIHCKLCGEWYPDGC